MSSITNPLNTGQQMTTNYDLSKIFLWDNRYDSENYVNNSNYNPVTILAGTVMGRIASTGRVVPCDASQTDGSQIPMGVLAQDVLLLGGALQKVAICVRGDVNQNALIFWTGNSVNTIVGNNPPRRMFDLIQDSGIKLVSGTEMSATDNQ